MRTSRAWALSIVPWRLESRKSPQVLSCRRMRFRFELDGEAYSKHKDAFKRILAKHGLRWQGSLERPLWASRAERVSAVFDRDEAHDALRGAALLWQGDKKSELLEELKHWTWEVGGRSQEETGPAAEDVTPEVEEALQFWDLVYKPNVDWLASQGRPQAWIEEDLKRWKHQRQTRRRELMGQATD